MAAVAAPVAATFQRAGRTALVLVFSNPPTHEADWLVSLAAPRRVTVLASTRRPKLGGAVEKRSPEIIPVGSSPGAASLMVAKRFWKQSQEAVLAPVDDPEAVILGASLAARLSVPLLVRERSESRTAVAEDLRELGVERIVVALSDPGKAPPWTRSRKYQSEVLGPAAIMHRVATALGASNIHNVIVARAPDGDGTVGRTAWLAPVMSVGRGAPVVLCHSASAAVAEADVADLIQREGLRPGTVTVLADYGSIGQNLVEIEGEDEPRPGGAATAGPVKIHYTVKTEPCIPRDVQKLATVGVGRIPLESAADASVLFARGLLREQILGRQPPRLLMVANAGVARRPLPLCETISRVTAEEFKNFGVHVDEFYGRLADSPEILTAAKSAHLIIYEGHLAYQDLINVPAARRVTTPDTFFEEEWNDLEGGDDQDREHDPPKHPEEPPAGAAAAPRPVVAVPEPSQLQGPLMGLPIIVLQSCDSLEEPTLWRIDELGGVAIIGSVTPIHSGSGSALINAAVDAALYRGGTLGEALRDAQNYMFCLEDLKARRGHKEQAKGRRVALSFRLWGDPELGLLPAPPGLPRQPPVAIDSSEPGTLTIHVPAERLPEARSSKYVAHMFPGSQSAGMVKLQGGDSARLLTPIYYFRLPLPAGALAGEDAAVVPLAGEASRVSFRIDRAAQTLYVVYYPEQESPGESIVLRWVSDRHATHGGEVPFSPTMPVVLQFTGDRLGATGSASVCLCPRAEKHWQSQWHPSQATYQIQLGRSLGAWCPENWDSPRAARVEGAQP